MLNETTLTKLRELRLSVMAEAFRTQEQNPVSGELDFSERFGMLVDAEWTARKSNRLNRLVKKARLAIPGACIEDISYHADRRLDKTLIARLSTGSYIQDNHNIIILGPTGAGKTYLSCALGMAACRGFYPVRYVRLPDLLSDLTVSREDNSYRKTISQYVQPKLLILDEWLLFPLKEADARDILEIVNLRCETASTIFCSQFDIPDWHSKLWEPTIADAVCDRIVHNAYKIIISGESMRKRNGLSI